jgi:hypothetical protein
VIIIYGVYLLLATFASVHYRKDIEEEDKADLAVK